MDTVTIDLVPYIAVIADCGCGVPVSCIHRLLSLWRGWGGQIGGAALYRNSPFYRLALLSREKLSQGVNFSWALAGAGVS